LQFPIIASLYSYQQIAGGEKATGKRKPGFPISLRNPFCAHLSGLVVAIDNPDPANSAPTTPAANTDVISSASLHRDQNRFVLTAVKLRATDNTDPMQLSQGVNPTFRLWQPPSPRKTDLQLQNDPRAFRVK